MLCFENVPVLTDGSCVKWGARFILNFLAAVLLAAVFVSMSAPAPISGNICAVELSWCTSKRKQVSSSIPTHFNGSSAGSARPLKTATMQEGNSWLPQKAK